LVLPYGTEHQIADRQNATPRAVIDLDDGQEQPCRVLRWGDSPEGTTLICGIFKLEAYNTPGMLSLLPPLLYFPAGSNHSNGIATAVNTLIEEANADRQGKLAILHRLADILFVQLIRAWLADPSTEASGWLAGMRDPQLASSLSAIHAQPAHAWTVGQLASHAAMSRSAFAARFTEIIGVPPATYLVGWRMQLGAQLLSDPNLSVVQVAMRVGYASDIAFSRAFKRLHGMSPAAYRRGVGAQG
jgi:AraC-like DNA-binding protein